MTRFYLKLIIPITVVCLTFMLVARTIGTTQPPNPALRGFVEGCEDKPQPCWYGIVPGVTTVEEGQSLFNQYGIETQLTEIHRGLTALNELAIVDSSTLFGCEIAYVQPIQSTYKDNLEFR